MITIGIADNSGEIRKHVFSDKEGDQIIERAALIVANVLVDSINQLGEEEDGR